MSVDMTKDSLLICSSSDDRTCRVWKVDGTPLKTLKFGGVTGDTDFIFRGCSFTREGNIITLQTEKRGPSGLTLWSKALLPVSHMHVSDEASCMLACSGNAIVVGTNEGEVQVFKLLPSSIEYSYKKACFDLPVTCMTFNPSGSRVMIGSADWSYVNLSTRHSYGLWVWALGVVVLAWLVWCVSSSS
mmetsp:Transcript_32947/g.57760  ORF Transcript_32947/g.57760 Transcript_32947/m.57760 type:complete len:187 (-) Transcript_32947:3931-4491(-)